MTNSRRYLADDDMDARYGRWWRIRRWLWVASRDVFGMELPRWLDRRLLRRMRFPEPPRKEGE